MIAKVFYPNEEPFHFNVPCCEDVAAMLIFLADGLNNDICCAMKEVRKVEDGDIAEIEGERYQYMGGAFVKPHLISEEFAAKIGGEVFDFFKNELYK